MHTLTYMCTKPDIMGARCSVCTYLCGLSVQTMKIFPVSFSNMSSEWNDSKPRQAALLNIVDYRSMMWKKYVQENTKIF